MVTDYDCPPQTFSPDDGDVRLTVAIGNGDYGVTRVALNGQVLRQGSTTVNGRLVGEGTDLHDSDLRVDTIVNDTNPITDRTVVYYRLECGATMHDFNFSFDVPTNGDSVVYHAT